LGQAKPASAMPRRTAACHRPGRSHEAVWHALASTTRSRWAPIPSPRARPSHTRMSRLQLWRGIARRSASIVPASACR
jgi:hypothetical protein